MQFMEAVRPIVANVLVMFTHPVLGLHSGISGNNLFRYVGGKLEFPRRLKEELLLLLPPVLSAEVALLFELEAMPCLMRLRCSRGIDWCPIRLRFGMSSVNDS